MDVGIAGFTPAQMRQVLQNLHKLPPQAQKETLELIEALTEKRKAQKRRESLLDFVMFVDPNYKIGAHHRHLAQLLEDMAYGRKDRATVSMPPRFGKSRLTSELFPAWYIGNFPDRQIMMVTHTADLSVDFGRKVRNIVDSDAFRLVFPEVTLASDSKSAGRWNTNKGGVYYAAGVGGAIAGRGAHFLCLLAGTRVNVAGRGTIPISEVSEGDEIATVSGFERVTKKWLTIHDEQVTINSVGSSLDHPFLTPSGWVQAGRLRVGDRILTQTLWSKLWTATRSLVWTRFTLSGRGRSAAAV